MSEVRQQRQGIPQVGREASDKLAAWLAEQSRTWTNAQQALVQGSARYMGAMQVFDRACRDGDVAAIPIAGRTVCQVVKDIVEEKTGDV